MKYKIESSIKDISVKKSLRKALSDNGALSVDDIKNILTSTLDGKGVSYHEFKDLQSILKQSKTLNNQAKQLIKKFIATNYKPCIASASGKQLTKNFKLSEFNCKDGTPVPDELMSNVKKLAENLQVLRDTVKTVIKINSSYRTKSHNDKVGGKTTSQHLTAKAADIVVHGLTPSEVKLKIEKLIKEKKMKQGGIGVYKSFVHYDIRGSQARW